MEIKGDNLEKILDLMALYQCYGNLCTDCPHKEETIPNDCTKQDCLNRIYDVIIGAK